MKEKVMAILAEVTPDVDFSAEKNLIEDAVIDSFDIVTIVNELNDSLDIDIPAREILPENFRSAETIVALVERYC